VGAEHKRFQRENYYRVSRMIGPIQEMPNFDMRVTVDETVRDYWGGYRLQPSPDHVIPLIKSIVLSFRGKHWRSCNVQEPPGHGHMAVEEE
jgi:hypothetical protein